MPSNIHLESNLLTTSTAPNLVQDTTSAWRAAVHGVAKSRTQLREQHSYLAYCQSLLTDHPVSTEGQFSTQQPEISFFLLRAFSLPWLTLSITTLSFGHSTLVTLLFFSFKIFEHVETAPTSVPLYQLSLCIECSSPDTHSSLPLKLPKCPLLNDAYPFRGFPNNLYLLYFLPQHLVPFNRLLIYNSLIYYVYYLPPIPRQ